MSETLSSLVVGQAPLLIAVLGLACLIGSVVTLRLFARVRRTEGPVQSLWISLAGLTGGATIWVPQFIATLPMRTSLADGAEFAAIALSFAIAVGAALCGFRLAALNDSTACIEGGGLVVGIGVIAVPYIGISTLDLAGAISWDMPMVVLSLALALGFGAVAVNRIARPVTRFCKYGGATAMMLAVTTSLLAALSAAAIPAGAADAGSVKAVSETFLAGAVLAGMILLVLSGSASHQIDLRSSLAADDRYRQIAMQDPLTGLANRASMESRLNDLIAHQHDDTARIAVVCFDLDRFREINDVYGHAAGNAVLKALAQRLADGLGPGEFICRSTGTQFVAFRHPIYARKEATAFGERLQMLSGEAIEWQDHSVVLSISAGVALFPDDAAEAVALMEHAGQAMYRAKAAGTAGIVAYDAQLDEESRTRSALAMDLRNAVDKGELELYYQPQNDAVSEEIVGFEALLRWNHPDRGMVSPAEFIPIAEETGLILPMGEWALREACREAARWKRPLRVAVNIAAGQLGEPTLPSLVHETLLETGLPASRLELEITESSIICDQQHALHVLRQVKALGVRVAMDDYGTGYSSLSTLQNFPFDKIKIDREFIRDLEGNPQSAAIVRSTLILGDSLGVPVLAEGVESAEHVAFLRDEGCAELQGFFFGKPMPAADAREIAGVAPMPEPVQPAPRPGPAKRPRKAVA